MKKKKNKRKKERNGVVWKEKTMKEIEKERLQWMDV